MEMMSLSLCFDEEKKKRDRRVFVSKATGNTENKENR